MKAVDVRPFGITHWLILIAGAAAGFGCIKATSAGNIAREIWVSVSPTQPGLELDQALETGLELSLILGVPFLFGWTPACLILQIAKPRARWRRLSRQPGFVACLIATVSAKILLTIWKLARLSAFFLELEAAGCITVSSGILWSWATMRLSRTCRPVPTWNDRLGRFTGAAWIIMGMMGLVLLCLSNR